MPNTHFSHRIRIWDLPTRGFHILLALCVAGLIATGEIGGRAMQWHFWIGYAVLTLVLFRIIWGFVGGHWSRFVNFVPSPRRLVVYALSLRHSQAQRSIGHNPLGALSVLGMLSLLLLQVVSGFMTDDEIANTGPWVALVPSEWVTLASEYHSDVGKVLLILLIALHIATVLYYKRIKNDDLITPMLTGDKIFSEPTHDSRDTRTSRLFALSILVGCAYVVYRLANLI
jgi:cytochrome b